MWITLDLHNGWNVDITTEVSGQVTEVGTLLDDGSHVDGFVPPCGLGNGLVGSGLCIVSLISKTRREDGGSLRIGRW